MLRVRGRSILQPDRPGNTPGILYSRSPAASVSPLYIVQGVRAQQFNTTQQYVPIQHQKMYKVLNTKEEIQ